MHSEKIQLIQFWKFQETETRTETDSDSSWLQTVYEWMNERTEWLIFHKSYSIHEFE